MYSFPNLEPVCCSMSRPNCFLLTCIQVSQVIGNMIWYSLLFINFPEFVVIHTGKGFSVVNEAEVDISLEFWDPTNISTLISGSSVFSKPSLHIYKFSVHVLLKPRLKDFEHYFASTWNERNCVVVGMFLCLYGNLVKEGTFLKLAKAASDPQRDKIWWRDLQDTIS